jgi:hypothetical protein
MADQLAAEGLAKFSGNPIHMGLEFVQLTNARRELFESIGGGVALWTHEMA